MHYNDVIMNAMTSQITSLRSVFRHRSNKTSKLRVTSLCVGNSQMASSAEKVSIWWRHHEHDGVLSHQLHEGLLNDLLRRISKKTTKLRVTGLCSGNSPVTGEFPAQRASNAENVSIWWHYHVYALHVWDVTCTPWGLRSPASRVSFKPDINEDNMIASNH